MYSLRKRFIIFSLFFLSLSVRAEITRSASIEGQTDSVRLSFNAHMDELMKRMGQWEATLARAGIEARFFLGAGDLRRAILQMPADGPGDVEIFVQFTNREVQPKRLGAVHQLLKEHDIDIAKAIDDIFGVHKKLDLFVKDAWTLKDNKPWFGEFGFFEDMGDTSLNQLIYSPKTNRIYGDRANLEALAKGKIRFTDAHKARKLEAPKSVTGTGRKSLYPETILRLALRSIRLRIDLMLAPNENHLSLDDSFDDVLKGFELYLGDCGTEELSKFRLNEAYLEQFLKIFRNRTNDELKRIEASWKNDFPRTYQLLKGLGLDSDLLVKPRDVGTDLDRLEFDAIRNNARYAAVKPFLAPDLSIRNPFKDVSLAGKLLPEIKPVARNKTAPQHIPEAILALFSPKLAEHIRHFDQLDREAKLETIEGYADAVEYFRKGAWDRIVKEKTFREEHFVSFPFIDPKGLEKGDTRTLLDFIREELARTEGKTTPRGATEETFNKPAIAEMTKRIAAAKKAGKTPTLFVDLDGTLYNDSSRMETLFKRYDAIHGTSYFKGVSEKNLPVWNIEYFLYRYLAGQVPDINELRALVKSVKEFANTERFSYDLMMKARYEPMFRNLLLEWKEMGARIVILTARQELQRKLTEEQLARDGIPADEVFLNTAKLSPAKYKEETLLSYKARHPEADMTAFFDNESANVGKGREAVPEMLTLRVFHRANVRTGKPAVFLSSDDADIFRIWARKQDGCAGLFQNF